MINKERRRISSSGRAQQLWDAIKAVRLQKQIPAITRMGRYMSRYYQLKRDDTQRLLDLAVEDNLIKLETKIGTKGTKSGVEEKAYRLPTSDMLSRERHDWYCFKCHAGGEVILCSTCHRVYHEECIASEEMPADEEDYVCKYCQAFQKVHDNDNKRDRRDLNHLFRLIILRSKKKLPERIYAREVPQPPSKNINDPLNNNNMTPNNSGGGNPSVPGLVPTNNAPNTPGSMGGPNNNGSSGPNNPQGQMLNNSSPADGKKVEEELWRASFLLKEQIDFAEIERKCLAIEYRDTQEFKADSHLLVHNIIIFHGVHSPISDSARSAFRDIFRDLRELETCRDCFRHSVEPQGDKHWFVKPCRPPHELVYAKQKGFPFWPAKVIKVIPPEGLYDVRFFGGYHQRALVDKAAIRPISVNIHSLQVKRTSALNKACEELRRHQEVLEKIKDSIDLSSEPLGNPFFEIKVEFPPEAEESEDSEEEEPNASAVGGGQYPGEIDPRTKEEESELMRKPSFVPGEGPSPHSPSPNVLLASSNSVNMNTSVLVPNTTTTTLYSSGPFLDTSGGGGATLVSSNSPSQQPLSLIPSGSPGTSTYTILHHTQFPGGGQMRLLPAGGIQLESSPVAAAAASGGHHHHHHHQGSFLEAGAILTNGPGGHLHPAAIIAAPGSMAGQPMAGGQEMTKKKRGRPKKSKKEEPEDFVSSSSSNQESRFINAGVQTPSKLLKTSNNPSGQVVVSQAASVATTLPPSFLSSHPSLVTSSNVLAASLAAGGSPGEAGNVLTTNNQATTVQVTQAAVQAAGLGPGNNPSSQALMAAGGAMAAGGVPGGRKAHGERELKEFADKLRQEFEQEKKRAVNVATRSLERDLERLKADHNTEIEELLEKHKLEMSENKKKQWCYHCEAEAIYWCCWNTAYCSIECQQEHWHKEHKRMCRRKR